MTGTIRVAGPASTLRDTGRAMSDQLPAEDMQEFARRQIEAVNRRDLDTLMEFCPPDGVYDTSPSGLGIYEGREAIRSFLRAYWDAFEDLRFELEDLVDFGHGVTFSVQRQHARPIGSSAYVEAREAHVSEWSAGMLARVTVCVDVDIARAAAERLAEERG
jgi:ketosteroid isomerase-like protein